MWLCFKTLKVYFGYSTTGDIISRIYLLDDLVRLDPILI